MNRKNPWTIERLRDFIGQEENYHLEFKSAKGILQASNNEANNIFNTLSTHLSAFLNSEGGLLVIGIEETDEKKQAGKAVSLSDGIPRSIYNGDRIQSRLCDRIQPSVANLVLVNTVVVGKQGDEDLLAFVIEVRQGVTAYQAADKKYYCRRSFSSEPMDDKDVRLRMLADNVPRIELLVETSSTPRYLSWAGYVKQFDNYQEAQQRLSLRVPPSSAEIEILLQSGKLKIHPDKIVPLPKKIEKFSIRVGIFGYNSGTVSIKRACIQYKLPYDASGNLELTACDQELDIENHPPFSFRDLSFDQAGKIMLYPAMKKLFFEFYIHLTINFRDWAFNEDVELILYLDGGSPERLQINLDELLNKAVDEFEQNLKNIQSRYPDVQLDQ